MKGTVRDSSGAALPGATVSASTAPPVTTKTGPDGRFSFQVTHAASSVITLTLEKGCYAAVKSITLTSNSPYDTGVTTLTLTPLPTTAADDDRYTFTQKPDGSFKLTVNCVTAIPANTFSASTASPSPILQRLVESSGKGITEVLTAIELPPTLKTIGNRAFINNRHVTGNFTIPRNVHTIGRPAFQNVGSGHIAASSTIASSSGTGDHIRIRLQAQNHRSIGV